MTVHDEVRHTMVDFMQMKSFSDDPLVLTEGAGIHVIDVEGRRYIDGLSGTFCASLGHGNTELAEAGATQLRRLAMAAPTMATNDRALELVDVLLGLLPDRYAVVKLLSGGSEATESAMKIARQFHKQTGNAGEVQDPVPLPLLPRRHRPCGRGQRLARLADAVRAAGRRLHPPPHAGPVPPALRRRARGRRGDLPASRRGDDRARGSRGPSRP